jgi:hypothetical protein
MKKFYAFFLALIALPGYPQSKIEYLKKNRFDLRLPNFTFPQKDFRIIGFGGYHGSAKTEVAEYALLKSLTRSGTVKYYLPETDFSIGHFLNQYLETGDTLFLKDLVKHYGIRVRQEGSIETYEKWKEIKKLNDSLANEDKLVVVGIDEPVTYKYAAKHLLEVANYEQNQQKLLQKVAEMVRLDTTDFSPYYPSYSKMVLRDFVDEYEKDSVNFRRYADDKPAFDHVIKNLKYTFDESPKRVPIIYQNYLDLSDLYDFSETSQFLRFGFSHVEKEREGDYPSFFTMLIENEVYPPEDVLSVIGYLTKSEVLWDVIYDDEGEYKTYTTDGDQGIGDYEREYFRGIDNLKKSKVSDLTLFRLNARDTPYSDGTPDLIEIIMQDDASNGEQVRGKSTTDFVDYAVLISNSEASTPIQELK